MKRSDPSGLGEKFVSLRNASAAPSASQIALVPGAEVPVLTLELPNGLRGQSREQVARRQLKDRAGLDDAHIQMRPIHLPRERDSWSRVMVTDGVRLDEWKTIAGNRCRALLPDYLALPTAVDIWTFHQQESEILARLGPDDGFTAPMDIALNLLRLHLQNPDTRPKAILMLGQPIQQIAELAQEFALPVINEATSAKALRLAEPKVLGHAELTFDLRRDPQLARSRLRRRVLPWRWPVLIGLIALGLWASTNVIETSRAQDRVAVIDAQTRDLVRQHFIPSGPLLDMRIQVSQALAERRIAATSWRSEVTALDLFATASGVLTEAGASLEIVNSVSEQELALSLRVSDFAAVDQLAQALRDAGLTVSIVESRVSEGSSKVRTEIRLTPPDTEVPQ